MKRSIFLALALVAIVLATVISSSLISSKVQAGSSPFQMLNGTFADQNLPVDGFTKITLISIPFSVTAVRKLEATSLMNVTSTDNHTDTVTCELDIDNAPFFNVTTNAVPTTVAAGISTSVSITSTTTGIAIGSHTFSVKCLGSSQFPAGNVLTMHSLGTSVIITN